MVTLDLETFFNKENISGMFAERLFKFTKLSSSIVVRCTHIFEMGMSANMTSYLACYLILW